LRICIIGKYPPIQGGVSMRTYWTAHRLAACGHEVHVITNAKEALPPFRMHMRAEDWARCEASHGKGSVTVHWTDPVDRSQSYIPMASPFVSKLATVAATVHSSCPFGVIFSHYMEPYGVAGYLASQMTDVPHAVRMAGSDAGRLWHHPQFEALYDHVLRSADVVVAAGAVAERAVQRGVDRRRIAAAGGYALPEDLFTPKGPRLDLQELRAEIDDAAEIRDAWWGEFAADWPFFGVYGKLGDNKGSFAILSAMQRLKLSGAGVGLVVLAHGRSEIERRFSERVQELGLTDRVLQIPFLPHWRVPEFLRGCLAVCCLEQNFPIGFHSPITPLEVLLCGTCLVASTEVIRKLPNWEQLPHGYGCVAVEDVNDIEDLTKKLAAIARDPEPAATVGARGREFAREVQQRVDFPVSLERILAAAAGRTLPTFASDQAIEPEPTETQFPLTQIAIAAIAKMGGNILPGGSRSLPKDINLATAQSLLVKIKRAAIEAKENLQSLAQAVEIEIAIAVAETECFQPRQAPGSDPLFRLNMRQWALGPNDLPDLIPWKDPRLRLLHFNYDVSEFRGAKTVADFPLVASPRPSHMIVFCGNAHREPLLVDTSTARFLELSNGKRTVREILRQLHRERNDAVADDDLEWAENLFRWGLIWLRQAPATNCPGRQ
jgi:glycosyltransferase involved in cell wall biosynthesis